MDIFQQTEALLQEVQEAVINNPEELEAFRIRYLGSKNKLKDIFAEMKNVPNERKKEFGQLVNSVKQAAEEKYAIIKEALESSATATAGQDIDLTLPGDVVTLGARHPIQLVKNQIIEIFKRLGFVVEEDREIEDDWHNFTALNMPEDHPARDMQDTFFVQVNPDVVLRTHTSSIQVRVMENQQPPIRILSPGRVFRNETISARSHCFFHQVEGLYIDEQVSFADLLQTLDFFVKELFGKDTRIKLRPSYFPFTEPSAEVDVTCFICGGGGCNVCKHSGWVEILGCGMVDPKVLENCNIDPKKYSGFAFGMGVERITMLKYQIKDIRLLSENDTRFLSQFRAAF
ncbi:MAG TPA: phenylalanine--tRNA ligase subunit alpha [Chitinophagales bacterium]|jgi:phenylalanyl-tRNA synthetase alpha chain|nr:phenylalanine--tRNA ligase subunit alpha [Chitinophagales bacterium]HPA35033.1 phenylalanine--tRNA ligase subunit alpha [Chitinophagales bacterium]HQD11447.1 phenylalanine--tRNA ligase subunit alpha [Chitinophagales bacterium]HQO31378.1 phenylalanine--tRNA ligase subunit alpha [Chitinophagales bacterium]HQO89179.1 phenylalanine--tRNA ligase subunit alpha [Chitinophagales bacterium]